jgi:hypothetical protein
MSIDSVNKFSIQNSQCLGVNKIRIKPVFPFKDLSTRENTNSFCINQDSEASKYRFLIVDDSSFNLFTLNKLLKKNFGGVIDEAYHGKQAL